MTSGEVFRALHQRGNPFVLCNVWDRGSALLMQGLGAKALATSSAAHAFTLGRGDGGTLTRDDALAHAQDILSVAHVPVQGDFENGFGDDPDTCAETVRLAAEIGLAGICIEDTAFPSGASYDHDLSVVGVSSTTTAARALPHAFVLTARADGFLTGSYGMEGALARLQAFEDAGADCLYAPIPPKFADQAEICRRFAAPVNVLIAGEYTHHPLSDYATIGAARLSLGSSLARATHRIMVDAGSAMFDHGDFTALGRSISGDTVNDLMNKGRHP